MDVYTMVTERIIKQLEEGYIPWHKPWAACLEGAFNRISRKPYSLLNQILLGKPGEYATFKQWQEIGGKVKKGEKSEYIVFWKIQEVKELDEKGEEFVRLRPVLKYYNVFHISQVENVCPLEHTEKFDTEPIETAEKVFRDYIKRENITLSEHESDRAFYRPIDDSITLPTITQFECPEEFYSTAFHECGHSTLKKERCDREQENKGAYFGNGGYGKEELIAEITSAAILHRIGIETSDTFRNSVAYIQGWLHALKNDRRLIVSASGKAEKAALYILGGN